MPNFQKLKQTNDISDIKLSTGHNSFDHVLGGGIPLGSLVMIEEDKFKAHSQVISKIYLAQGIKEQNSIYLATLDRNPQNFIKSLPLSTGDNTVQKDDSKESLNDDMKIAWRYNQLPLIDSTFQIHNNKGNFDLSKKIAETTINSASINFWHYTSGSKFTSLLQSINDLLKSNNDKFSKDNTSFTNTNCLRILINSFGSPFWYSEEGDYKAEIIKFLTILKCLVKHTSAICLISVPRYLLEPLFPSADFLRLENLMDFIVELKSISKSDEISQLFKDYSGFLKIKKLSAVNSLTNNYNGNYDLGYKISSRKFVIETIHLPPDIEETNEMNPTDIQPSSSCSGTKKQLFEF